MLWLIIAGAHAATLSDLSAGELIITELHPDPAAASTARGQWFEVTNASGSTVDLDGLVISDGGSQGFTVSGALSVAAGGQVVFATRSSSSINGGLPGVDYVYSTTSYSLPAGNQRLDISFGAVTFDTVSFADPTAGVATARDAFDGTWCDARDAYGDGDYGTPGASNAPCVDTAADLSAGELVVNELMVLPSTVSWYRGQWIEITNTTADEVSLLSLAVSDSDGGAFSVDADVRVGAGEHALLALRVRRQLFFHARHDPQHARVVSSYLFQSAFRSPRLLRCWTR